jgi:hypothetical protein
VPVPAEAWERRMALGRVRWQAEQWQGPEGVRYDREACAMVQPSRTYAPEPCGVRPPPSDDRAQPGHATRQLPARPSRPLWLGLTLLTLVGCAHPHVTFAPDTLRGVEPISAQVNPHLWRLTERWQTGRTVGEAPVGDLLRQTLVDDPQAPLRVTYVTSHLDIATVVSTTFYPPHAYQAHYQLTVWVESPGTSAQ